MPVTQQQILSFNSGGSIDKTPTTDVVQEIRKATVQLGELRDRLMNVTRRIRNLKTKCSRLYPDAFGECEKSLGSIGLGNIKLSGSDDEDGLLKDSSKPSSELKECEEGTTPQPSKQSEEVGAPSN